MKNLFLCVFASAVIASCGSEEPAPPVETTPPANESNTQIINVDIDIDVIVENDIDVNDYDEFTLKCKCKGKWVFFKKNKHQSKHSFLNGAKKSCNDVHQ